MAEVILNEAKLNAIIDKALKGTVAFLTGKIKKITPRDPNRPPKDTSQYVSGNLEQSVIFKKNPSKPLSYFIGISSGFSEEEKNRTSPEDYGYYLEFGTKYMKPRSFLRKGLLDYSKETEEYFTTLMRMYAK